MTERQSYTKQSYIKVAYVHMETLENATEQNKEFSKTRDTKWAARRTGYAKGYARVCRASDICQAISNKRLANF